MKIKSLMKKSKIKLYQVLDTLLLVVGLTITGVSIFGLYQNIAFELLLFSGAMGTTCTIIGGSLIVDTFRMKSYLK